MSTLIEKKTKPFKGGTVRYRGWSVNTQSGDSLVYILHVYILSADTNLEAFE